MSQHTRFKWVREVEYMHFKKKGYNGIIPFVYEGKEEIHKYMQYQVSMTVCIGRIVNQRKVPKWLPFKNYMSESLNFDVHV